MKLLEELTSDPKHFVSDVMNLGRNNLTVVREAAYAIEFFYSLTFTRPASNVVMEIMDTKVADLIEHLKNEGFSISMVRGNYGRSQIHRVLLTHVNLQMAVEMEHEQSAPNVEITTGDLDEKTTTVTICYSTSEGAALAYSIKDQFIRTDIQDNSGKVLLFEKDSFGDMVLTHHKVSHEPLDIPNNYNDDFMAVHERIDKWMGDYTMKNNKLVLFHGPPGTGKTNYIKYLLNHKSNAKKIYIPPVYVQSIADPGFFPIIKKEKHSLLIIEDAEKVLVNREHTSDSNVISTLLNLCDGIMADVLNFKIIATFNTDEDKIDEALKRKGRMFLKYNFGPLNEAKTTNLYQKVHGRPAPKKQMTLADIYNEDNEMGPEKVERRVGFGL